MFVSRMRGSKVVPPFTMFVQANVTDVSAAMILLIRYVKMRLLGRRVSVDMDAFRRVTCPETYTGLATMSRGDMSDHRLCAGRA
jgi:hypothetical protein